jgi:tryptophan synthase alpha chain
MKNRLMCHLVAGFPTMEDSWEVAKIMAEKGSSYIEVQFPFSDPSADGPVIQAACTRALENGFTVEGGFELVKKITDKYDVPVFIMSYSTIAYRNGLQSFIDKSLHAGAAGLIIPDLLPPDDEGLYDLAAKNNIPVIPVFPVSIMKERLELLKKLDAEYMYIALRRGITGAKTEIDADQIAFLKGLQKNNVKLLAGFGIRERDQVEAIMPHINAAIIGSELVRTITEAGNNYKRILADKLENLIG